MFSLQKSPHHALNEDSQKFLFLRGINKSCTEALDLVVGGDITQVPWNDIKTI